MLKITQQLVNTWTKRIQREKLKGSTYFLQRGEGRVTVAASADHQSICQAVLGPGKQATLSSYKEWDDVSAHDLAELIHQIDHA